MAESRPTTELTKRVITALLGVALILGLIIFGGWIGIFIVTLVISIGMIHEVAEMLLTLPQDHVEKRSVLIGATWFAVLAEMVMPRIQFDLLVFVFLVLFAYYLFTAVRHVEHDEFLQHFKELMYSVFGILYVAFLPLYLPLIHASRDGVHWTILFLFIVWAGDSGAYFAGKKFGKVKLYPLISPKKTREGALGGLAAGVMMALFYKIFLFHSMSWGAVLIVPILVGTVAQVGDLCESFLKRAFDKKDSGSILPGHGGFLDRFDAMVFSLPVMYACVRMFG